MIYLDNAATTVQKPQSVIDAVSHALLSGTGNCGRGVNEASLSAGRIVHRCRSRIAKLFGFPSPNCVAFTSNATEALNTAVMGLSLHGKHVVTTASEHNSVLRPLYFQKNNGAHLDIVPIGKTGLIDYTSMRCLVTHETAAVFITLSSNVTGNITDLHIVSSIIKDAATSDHKPLLVADASQAAGFIPINASDIDGAGSKIDVLCFTGHKSLMGPQGTGGICVMPGIKINPLKRGGSGSHSFEKEHPSDMPSALEAGTLNAHGIAGLEAALSFIQDIGLEAINAHDQKLTEYFYYNAKDIPKIKLYGDFSEKDGHLQSRAPIVSVNIGDMDSSEISDILSNEYGIATRAGAHCAPLVHKSFGTVDQGMVRFSFGYFTTKSDIDSALNALRDMQK